MIFVGDDWAEENHDVYVMDVDGARLASRRLPEGLAGIRGFHELVAAHVEEPGQVVIGIETDRGLWVAALGAAGYQVFAVNPLAVARYRDRHQVSGAKSDAGDAKLLADLVRTDRHHHRPLAGDSPDVEAIKVLARAHQNLIWARTRHTNALRSALREYYPVALEAFDDLARPRCPGHSGPRCHTRRSRASEPVKDPVGPQTRWATTQPRCPRPADRGGATHRAARRPRRGHRRVRRDHPRRGRHHRRAEPPDHRPRGPIRANIRRTFSQ